MKKIIVGLGIAVTFIIILIVSIVLLLQRNKKEQKISLLNWYDYEAREVIIIPTDEKVKYSMPYPFSASITLNSDDFLEQVKNDEKFVEEKICYIDEYSIEGYILFGNNNYYFLYNINDSMCIRNLICTIEYENLSLAIPLQRILTLDIVHIPTSKDRIKAYFDETTFADSKLFYTKFDTEFIRIEEASERIIISSLDIYSKKRYEIYLNYRDKSVAILIENELQSIYE